MPKATQEATVTQTVTQTVDLKPSLKRMVSTKLTELRKVREEQTRLKSQGEKIKADIVKLFQQAKQSAVLDEGCKVDDATLRWRSDMQSRYDSKKFLARGLNPEDFKTSSPKKAYLDARFPGDSDE